MTVDQEMELKELRDAAQKILILTERAEFGILTWNEAVGHQMKRIVNIYNGPTK